MGTHSGVSARTCYVCPACGLADVVASDCDGSFMPRAEHAHLPGRDLAHPSVARRRVLVPHDGPIYRHLRAAVRRFAGDA